MRVKIDNSCSFEKFLFEIFSFKFFFFVLFSTPYYGRPGIIDSVNLPGVYPLFSNSILKVSILKMSCFKIVEKKVVCLNTLRLRFKLINDRFLKKFFTSPKCDKAQRLELRDSFLYGEGFRVGY